MRLNFFKSKSKCTFLMLIIFLFSLSIGIEQGFCIETSNESGFTGSEMPLKSNVPLKKPWNITLNQMIDWSTVNGENIYVLDSAGDSVGLNYALSQDKKTVIVSPLQDYRSGQGYYLYIAKGIKSILGNYLNSPVRMKFTTASLQIGGVFCDYLGKETWDTYWKNNDLLKMLTDNGCVWARVGVTTVSSSDLKNTPQPDWRLLNYENEYWSSLEYSEAILRDAAQKGMKTDLFLFLSDKAAHAGTQDAPKEWQGLSVEDTGDKLQTYCYNTTKYFMDKGIKIDIYEIGNEINMGILNFRPFERIPVPDGVNITTDMEYLKNNVWNIESILLKRAIQGVKEANPDAKIGLHTAGLGINKGDTYTKSFFETMINNGVDFDYIGLSYPYGNCNVVDTTRPYFKSDEFKQTLQYLHSLNKEVMFCEYAYPNDSQGISALPDDGYPYTPEGQANWVKDFLSVCLENNIFGAFYFYPEYFPGISYGSTIELESSGLLVNDSQVQPAMLEFNKYK